MKCNEICKNKKRCRNTVNCHLHMKGKGGDFTYEGFINNKKLKIFASDKFRSSYENFKKYLEINSYFDRDEDFKDTFARIIEVVDFYDWICILKFKDKIIGFYKGVIKNNYSDNSLVMIHALFQGKGLCRTLSSFTYGFTYKKFSNIHGIKTTVAPESGNKIPATRCYIQACWENNLKCFITTKNQQILIKTLEQEEIKKFMENNRNYCCYLLFTK